MGESTTIAAGAPVGRYEILSLLSAGGMGELYHARDPELGRELVVKLLPRRGVFHPDAVERFVREARAASALNHPNIVTVYEIGESPSGHFIAMELIEGRTLREIRAESPSIPKIARIGAQVARALAVAHAAGIIHRDIKPENLMLRDDGYLKVLDFGIAQLTATNTESTDISRITQPGVVVGTMRYMSPEQAQGNPVTPASDMFSLGIVLYELAAGRHPFDSSSDMAVLSAIILRDAVPPSRINSRVPQVFDSLVMRMLSKDPRQRPSAVEVDEILDSIVALQTASRHASTAVATQTGVIGREVELEALAIGFDSAKAGRASLLCVSGEPGIGKTTLIEAFLRGLAGSQAHSVALGRCSERLAGAEAYLPMLDAIEDLLHDDRTATRMPAFQKLAPTWAQMLTGNTAPDSNGDASTPQSQERMKRELAAFLEKVCDDEPLVLLIEDIHWADISTVDVLGYVLTRLRDSRLLTVATYRPAELQLSSHPFLALKLDLQTRGAAKEIPLSFLTEEYVGRFIEDRFPKNRFPDGFTHLVHSRTEGSPLFVEDLLRYLKARGSIVPVPGGGWELPGSLPDLDKDIPESMRSMVERKVGQLDVTDRNLLAAASVQGYSFDSAIVAKAMKVEHADIEDRLENLDRVYGFVRRAGEREFPNGEISGRYRFVHVLYQNALYAALSVSRRVALSKAVGEGLLELHQGNPGSAAAELGFLFETAREFERAVGYFALAAEASLGVFAFDEASRLAHRGLAIIARQPPSPQMLGMELSFQLILGSAAAVLGGYAASDARAAMDRARVLAEQLGTAPQLSPALWGLHAYNLVRGEIRKSLEIAERALAIANEHKGEMALMTAHTDMGITLRFMGNFDEAIEHFEKAATIYDPAKQLEYLSQYHMDPGVFCLCEMTRTLWGAGQVDRALSTLEKAISFARASPDPRTVAFSLLMGAVLHHLMREPELTVKYGDEGIEIADEHQIIQERAWITTSHGWGLVGIGKIDEGIAEIETSLAMRKRMNADLDLPYALTLLAEAYAARGDIARARDTLHDAIEVGNRNADLWAMADVYRSLGDLALRVESGADQSNISELDRKEEQSVRENAAEDLYLKAIEIAREQGAKSFELRASVSLGKLMERDGRIGEAIEMIEPLRKAVQSQRPTPDSIDADMLLNRLRAAAQSETQTH
jgi:tetratricopeptide (TPR) repeat protein